MAAIGSVVVLAAIVEDRVPVRLLLPALVLVVLGSAEMTTVMHGTVKFKFVADGSCHHGVWWWWWWWWWAMLVVCMMSKVMKLMVGTPMPVLAKQF